MRTGTTKAGDVVGRLGGPRLAPLWKTAFLGATLVSAFLAACDACHPPTPSSPPVATEQPSVRLYFTSDLAGALEPCGCVKDQLGGLSHAAAWVDSERAHAPASLFASAGPTFFMDPLLDGDHRVQDVAKAEALGGALKRLGFAGFAPGVNDWAAGAGEMSRIEDASGAPALLANGAADAGAPLLPVKVVTVGSIKVALIGAGVDPGAMAPSPSVEGVRAAMRLAKDGGANLTVLLASVGRGEAKRIADAVPELTAIIVGDVSSRGEANVPSPPGERVGNVIIAETANHLQAVGALDFYVRGGSYDFADGSGLENAQKRAELTRRIDELHVKIANWEKDKNISPGDLVARRADLAKLEADRARYDDRPAPPTGSYFRYVVQEIRESLGDDKGVQGDLTSYYRAINDKNKVDLAGRVPPPVPEGQPTYAGIEACSGCHRNEKSFWDKTAHAKAYVTLSSQFKEFNLDCVSCHVTGYGKAGGSTVTHVDKLKDVQCEVCHGPSSLHVAAPTKVKVPVVIPPPETCIGCHHPPHVEGFDAVAKMNDIIGVGHGR